MNFNISFIDISGEKYPVFYGMYGLRKVVESCEFDTLGDFFNYISSLNFNDVNSFKPKDIEVIERLAHEGFLVGAEMESKEYPFALPQTSAIIWSEKGILEDIMNAFSESMPQGEDPKKAKGGRAAKKG
ncbi:MAG: hypothetical protein ACO2Y1_07750 [Flavobacteriaceae bacterium]